MKILEYDMLLYIFFKKKKVSHHISWNKIAQKDAFLQNY